MINFKNVENKFDIKQVMLNNEPDIFYNLKIDLVDKDKMNNQKLSLIDYLTDNIEKLKPKLKFINLFIPYEKISKKEFVHFYKLYQKTKDIIPCYVYVNHEVIDDEIFRHDKETIHWELKTIIKANREIDKVCNFIKNNNFSPFEALAYIHNYVSNVANYNISDPLKFYWYGADQYFAGAYKDLPEVVCAGYSSLMKEIIDNLKMPELSCELISVELKHLKKNFTAKHSRCFIKIKDDKYGLDQTVFDDPTWDNDKDAKCSKYTHFAMPNDSHEDKKNGNYKFYPLYHYSFPKNKNVVDVIDFNEYQNFRNNSKNQIDQKMVETAYANIMHKTCPKQKPSEIYSALKQIAQESYKEQVERQFIGNITQQKLVLTRKEVYEICGEILQKPGTQELEKTY